MLLLVLCCILALCCLKAQTSQELIDAFSKKYKDAPALQTSFVYQGAIEGKMILQGDCFYMEMDEYKIYCNGKTKWFYNTGIDEVSESEHNPNSTDILENPASFFRHLHTGYYITATPAMSKGSNGEDIWEVTLLPSSTKSPFQSVVLALRVSDTTPVRISYTLKEGGSNSISLKDFEVHSIFPASQFEFGK